MSVSDMVRAASSEPTTITPFAPSVTHSWFAGRSLTMGTLPAAIASKRATEVASLVGTETNTSAMAKKGHDPAGWRGRTRMRPWEVAAMASTEAWHSP